MEDETKPIRKNKLDELRDEVQEWFHELKEMIQATPPNPRIESAMPTTRAEPQIETTPEVPEITTEPEPEPEVSVNDSPVRVRLPFNILR